MGLRKPMLINLQKGQKNPEINRMLGSEGTLGKMLGLEKDWAVHALKAGGNYGEIFDRYLGEKNSSWPLKGT